MKRENRNAEDHHDRLHLRLVRRIGQDRRAHLPDVPWSRNGGGSVVSAPLADLIEAIADIPVGAGPDAVAAFLEAQGCRGRRGSATLSPVSAYAAKRTGFSVENYTVTEKSLHFTYWEDPARYRQEIVRLPEVVGRFLRNFDFGAYPRLVG
jgi:hypothetical protein